MYPAWLLEHAARADEWRGTPDGSGDLDRSLALVVDSFPCRFETIPPHLLKIPLIGEIERAAWLLTWTRAGLRSGMVVTVLDSRSSGPPAGSRYALERVQQDPAGRFFTGICVEVDPHA